MTVTAEGLRVAGVEEPFAAVEGAIEAFRAGNATGVAVISPPYGGREAVLDHAEAELGGEAERVRLDGAVASHEFPAVDEHDAVLIDDCQHLYRREIGGFDALDRALDRMAMSDALVVTSWNSYAWSYLSAVRDVADSFPVEAVVPPLSPDGIAALVEHHADGFPEFVETDEAGRIKTVDVDRAELNPLGGRSVTVPVPKPNTEWVTSWWQRDEDRSLEAVTFAKLHQVSEGNPGVALAEWDASVRDGRIAPAYVDEPDPPTDLSGDQAFLLRLIVSMESVSRDALADVVGERSVDKELQALLERDLVVVDGEDVGVAPDALGPAVEALRRRRLLW